MIPQLRASKLFSDGVMTLMQEGIMSRPHDIPHGHGWASWGEVNKGDGWRDRRCGLSSRSPLQIARGHPNGPVLK